MFAASKTDGAVATTANYIEDVFSTYLYTGNGSTQTITNNIDLSTKGGLVWIKQRSVANAHALYDTARGVRKAISSNFTLAELTAAAGKELTAFNTTGFSLGTDDNYTVNANATTFVSWTFRKQAKFFDVVTYTGNGTYPRNISHNLGSTPGCIIVKKLSATSDWFVYHRSLSVDGTFGPYRILLNTTAAQSVNDDWKNAPTSTQFTVNNSDTNGNGVTYVAYLFAHDAGGFGAAGTDNVISCGSYTGNGSTTGPVINLGWEPQWILLKPSTVVDNWNMIDNMRGFTTGGSALLYANTTNAEGAVATNIAINSTGFQPNSSNSGVNGNGQTYIYIAIRRGPMKTPTSGTSVFSPVARIGNGSNTTLTSAGFPVDLFINRDRAVGNSGLWPWYDRMRGKDLYLTSTATTADTTYTTGLTGFDAMSGVKVGVPITPFLVNDSSVTYIDYNFRRAPGFFDEVCYTGTGSATTFNHNLTVVPELMIVKRRNSAVDGYIYSSALGNTKSLALFAGAGGSDAAATVSVWNNTTPTSTVFSVQTQTGVNASGGTYVAYLFATVAGVSKVGSYTGNGSNQTINCGFTAGARFVMIKRTDSTGDWYVWDTARGIVSGNDPRLSLNSTAAEVTTDDSIDPDNSGFIVNQLSATNINVSSATYIFLAVS